MYCAPLSATSVPAAVDGGGGKEQCGSVGRALGSVDWVGRPPCIMVGGTRYILRFEHLTELCSTIIR